MDTGTLLDREDSRPIVPPGSQHAATLSDLRARALIGSESAIAELLTKLRYTLARRLRQRLPRDAADDVDDYTQEALWRIWTRLHECHASDERGLRAWAFTVAWRVAVADRRRRVPALSLHVRSEAMRHALARADTEAFDGLTEPQSVAFTGDAVPSDSAQPSTAPCDGPMAELLARLASDAQRHLSVSTQELLYTRLVERASWSELGARYGITAPAARRRYQRAQVSLRRYVLEDLRGIGEPQRSQAIIWLSSARAASTRGSLREPY
ncbi:MAG TPA: sigma-70 family RNA polymerase sigma factor [Candidatus Elarobacter sp.]|nr:sigma-70 family RNA polymerase sigma factor [Candidatus Elarobacter sp.]